MPLEPMPPQGRTSYASTFNRLDLGDAILDRLPVGGCGADGRDGDGCEELPRAVGHTPDKVRQHCRSLDTSSQNPPC